VVPTLRLTADEVRSIAASPPFASSLWINSREARIESFSFRFVLGDFIDTMESTAEIDMCEPGRKGPILVRVRLSTG
jgi:hypothetical protein